MTTFEVTGASAVPTTPVAASGPRPAHTDGQRTLRQAVRDAEQVLAASGVPSPRADAEQLATHVLGVGRAQLWTLMDAPVLPAYDDLVARRAQRIPLQHITGVAHFRTVSLSVGPGVFCPRPETEVVVGHALGLLTEVARPVVVDLCAGSGAMAASVATEMADAEVHAVERDPGARPWLRRNADAHGFTAHLRDIDGCLPDLAGRVDAVVANPPYIPEGSVPRDPEVARFDPATALYSGPDGLHHMRLVEETAARLLRPGGHVLVEHGDQQGESAPAVFVASGRWATVSDHPDLTGRDRYLVARRAGRG